MIFYCTNYNYQANSELFWGISSDTVFTTTITIMIFIAGYLAKQIYDSRKEINRLISINEYILLMLKNNCKGIPKISKKVLNLSNKIGELKHQNIEFNVYSNLQLDSIKTVSEIDLFNALFIKIKSKDDIGLEHYGNILSSIEYLRLFQKLLKINFSEYFDKYDDYSNKWSSEIDSILRAFDKYRSENEFKGIKRSDDNFLMKFDKVLFEWKSENEKFKDFSEVTNRLLDPLKQLCISNLADIRSNEILPIVVHAKYSFDNIKHLKTTYSQLFGEESERLTGTYKNLSEAISYFEKNSTT